MSTMPAARGVTTASNGWRVTGGSGADGQLLLFPRPRPALRTLPDVHAISIPAGAFTGDFYFVHRADNRLWFALGDVAGKGLNAAVLMAMIQEELERTTCDDPSANMMRLHAYLKPILPRNRFATAAVGYLDDDGTLRIANAGHCEPLVVRKNGSIERISSTGPVLGVLSSSQWCTFETTLGRGESLILYSDGVLEARSPSGEEFGIERIESNVGSASAQQIAERIHSAAMHHSGGVQEDDLTLLVIRR